MKNIFVIGAGRSASSLIKYLIQVCAVREWKLTVGDFDLQRAKDKLEDTKNTRAIQFDIQNIEQREREISNADLVISMLPAKLHLAAVESCVKFGKHLITASYVTDEIQKFDQDAKNQGIIILNECGLDPGIDHMSGMKVIDNIRSSGAKLTGFETFTGGLLAPNEDDNPWKYKFTWNPRNVVTAGQGGVKYLQEGKYKYIPYHRLFRRTEVMHIQGYGHFEGYANRDSLKYRDLYGLHDIHTLYRGTLRRPGFCKAWNVFVQLGATDDTYELKKISTLTHREFINLFLSYNPHDSVELKLAHYLNLDMGSDEMYKLKWLDMFEDILVGLDEGTPARVLEHILKKKWTLTPQEKDMIVMWHKFDFILDGEHKQIQSTLVFFGEDEIHTGMSRTVGLPLGIATKLILEGKINQTGVCIPTIDTIYNPILQELKEEGVDMIESEMELGEIKK